MTRLLCVLSCAALFLVSAVPLYAQTPAKGMTAAGGDLGVFFPDDAFENALTLDAFGEYYLTPRVSVRGLLGWTNPGFDGQTEDHFRQVKLIFSGAYNWEFGKVHPYVIGGAGAYFVRIKRENQTDPSGETRGGLNLGGGVEYFTNDSTSVKGEARWDIVSHPTDLSDATGLSVTIGIKRYF